MNDDTELTQPDSPGIHLQINTRYNDTNNSDNILSPIKIENHTVFNTFIHYFTLFYNFIYAYCEYCVDHKMI